VIADLGHGLRLNSRHAVGRGSRIDGATVVPFGQEGSGRAGNLRNTATVTARLYPGRSKFDVVHNFGRLAYSRVRFRGP
jgi:hypothetical protein